MSNLPRPSSATPGARGSAGRLPPSLEVVRRRLHILQWLVPVGLLGLVILYELLPAEWIAIHLGRQYHLWAEVLVYGTIGPVLAYVLLAIFRRWLEERETSELQAALLAQARARAQANHQLSDDALQTLFAAGVLLDSLHAHSAELPPGVVAQLSGANQAIAQAITQLRTRLLSETDSTTRQGPRP